MLNQINFKNVHLLPGLFSERAEVNRSYPMELSKQGLLQNFYIEAGIVRTHGKVGIPLCKLTLCRDQFCGDFFSLGKRFCSYC